MFQDDIFDEWLESESKSVLHKFKTNEPLSIEDKMILTLKAQTNHFHHLDQDIRKDIADLDNKTMTAIADLDNKTMTAIADLDNKTMTAIADLDNKTMNAIADLDNKTMNAIADLDNKTMTAIAESRKDNNEKFEKIDEKFEVLGNEIKNIYKAINNQTWKMLGSIGLIVVLSKLAESVPFLIKF